MRSLFLRLTELGEGIEDTRRRVDIDDLVPEGASPDAVQALLDRLAGARLVTLGEGTAEVAHEVLIREWPTLRGWLDEDREGIRLHRRLGDAARLWETGGREPSDLYRGARLAAALEWADAHRRDLNATEREFLDESRAAGERDAERQRRANRRLRALLAGAGILLVLAVFAGVVAFVQRGNAREQALRSDAERVGALALAETTLDRRFLLAVAGMQLDDRAETRGDLLSVLQATPAAFRLIRPSRSDITALAVSPTGRLLASGDAGGAVRFYDIRTWRPIGPAVRLAGQVSHAAMAFAPDGNRLAVATAAERSRSNLYLFAPAVAQCAAGRLLALGSLGQRTTQVHAHGVLARRDAPRRCRGDGLAAGLAGAHRPAPAPARDAERARRLAAEVPAAAGTERDVGGVQTRRHPRDLGTAGRDAAVERRERTRHAQIRHRGPLRHLAGWSLRGAGTQQPGFVKPQRLAGGARSDHGAAPGPDASARPGLDRLGRFHPRWPARRRRIVRRAPFASGTSPRARSCRPSPASHPERTWP